MKNDNLNSYIGIDLGTSAVKLLLVASDGTVLSSASESYPVHYPRDGWSEQNPKDWFDAVMRGLRTLLEDADKSLVRGISFGGQMHGLVALNKRGEVVRPCILWNDGRTFKETEYLNKTVGKAKLAELTGNIAFAGFTAPKLLWLKANEPDNFDEISKILLPKDYLAFRFCGALCTDYSDASGTLLLDVENRRWSRDMLDICGISENILPELCESWQKTGKLNSDIADALGLPHDVAVCAGAGDNAAAAIGNGISGDGKCNISLGTSGTLFIACDSFKEDRANALHSFCHADGGYHLMGCILSAASCNEWWSRSILNTADYAAEQRGIEKNLGENKVYFLPYLMGERSPHNDVYARGAFVGMRPDTTRSHMTQAVLEGVAFAINDCLAAAKRNGAAVGRTSLCGGGAKSPLWRQIIADVTGLETDVPKTERGAAFGAATLAMTGCGEYPSVRAAANALKCEFDTVYPDDSAAKYRDRYAEFAALYPSLKEAFALMG